jgi:hypothetical protein
MLRHRRMTRAVRTVRMFEEGRNDGKVKEILERYYECIQDEVGSTVDECVGEKVRFDLVEREVQRGISHQWERHDGQGKMYVYINTISTATSI